ncbi:MAG: alpha/beta fold hydrolase [Candidatus Babeliales bacterium]
MKLNHHVNEIISVQIRGKEYPVAVAGTGIPCLSIGTGTLGQRTLSEQFKKFFKVYSSELYFDQRFALAEPTSLTMDQMVDDIAELSKQLHLSRFVLFGFSAFGIVALEFAKKYPALVKGIIMVGTPPNSNAQIGARNNAYFEANAEPERKRIDTERSTEIAKEDLNKLTYSDRFLRRYVYRSAPRYWYIPDFDCSELWHDIIVDKIFDHLFNTIFPQTDVMKNLEKITCPIFLAAGKSDYDCCPWMWKEIKNLPRHMIISEFTKSGHYPQYEEQALFDKRIETWVQKSLK